MRFFFSGLFPAARSRDGFFSFDLLPLKPSFFPLALPDRGLSSRDSRFLSLACKLREPFLGSPTPLSCRKRVFRRPAFAFHASSLFPPRGHLPLQEIGFAEDSPSSSFSTAPATVAIFFPFLADSVPL